MSGTEFGMLFGKRNVELTEYGTVGDIIGLITDFSKNYGFLGIRWFVGFLTLKLLYYLYYIFFFVLETYRYVSQLSYFIYYFGDQS